MKATQPQRRAFTLIEMLVVISIIVLLISLLMPTLGSAKHASLAAKCVSNLHQIGVAYRQREADVNMRAVNPTRAESWHGQLAPYVGYDNEVFICPEDDPFENEALAVHLDVYSGSSYLYTMPLEVGPWCIRVDRNTSDFEKFKINPHFGQVPATDIIPERGYMLFFEDLRPDGGDQDFRDVVLRVEEVDQNDQGDKGPYLKVTYVQDAAGYHFNLVRRDGEIVWEDMDNGGKTKPGAITYLRGGLVSYGMNWHVEKFREHNLNPMLMLDYEHSMADPVYDLWDNWLNPQGTYYSFARHFHKTNVMFRDGSVRAGERTDEFDPLLVTQEVYEAFWGQPMP